jgi:hypothetical protein
MYNLGVTIFSTFLQNDLLMYVSINKQLTHFQSCFSNLSQPCKGKG